MAWWPGNRTTEDVVSGIFGTARDLGYGAGKVGDAFSVAANGMMLVPASADSAVNARSVRRSPSPHYVQATRKIFDFSSAGTAFAVRLTRFRPSALAA